MPPLKCFGQFWLILPVGIFVKLGPQIFWKLDGVFYVSFHEKNNQKNIRELIRRETAMQCMMTVNVV